MIRRPWLLLIPVLLVALGTETASAATTYLRPNGVISSSKWAVTGAPTASEALDDNVLETETPAATDYISNSESTGAVKLDLGSVSLSGVSGLTAKAWFYTPTASPVKLNVKETGGSGFVTVTASSIGWHSVSLFLTKGQSQLDGMYMEFVPATGSGSRQVSAAFVRLDYEGFASSVYWGAWMDGEVSGDPKRGDAPWDKATWEEFRFDAGRKTPSIIHFGQPPPWITKEFVEAPLQYTAEKEAIPLMDMASDLSGYAQHIGLREIAEGEVDEDLEQWAVEAAEFEAPFFLRWDWEMNLAGETFPWAEEAKEDPSAYVDAWRHFHDITVEAGASNITWVWCPNVSYPGSTPLIKLWPGAEYVDWTCMDGYNHGTNPLDNTGWFSFNSVFGETYKELTTGLASEKPIMIGETASTEFGGSKAQWVTDALVSSLPNSFPKIKALVWFNWNIKDGSERWDWQIESSGPSEVSFASAISSPYYAPGTFGSLTPLTKIKPLP